MLPIGSSRRRWLNQSSQARVARSTASALRQGPRRRALPAADAGDRRGQAADPRRLGARAARHGRDATLITGQIPVDRCHDLIGATTLGDAILGRLIHNAQRLQLSDESLAKKIAQTASA